jgi:hypothetical protein
MYGLIDDMCELRETIYALKIEKRALIDCLKCLLNDSGNPGSRQMAEAILKALDKPDKD